jgi:hypothetical protein
VGAAPGSNKPIVLSVDETFPAPNLTNRCGIAVSAHVFGRFTLLKKAVSIAAAAVQVPCTRFIGPSSARLRINFSLRG